MTSPLESRLRELPLVVAALVCAACLSTPASGPIATPKYEFGVRTGVSLGDGEPANDLPIPIAVLGRLHLDDRWAMGLGVELASGDFEKPAKVVGLDTADDTAVDADQDSTIVRLWAERILSDPTGSGQYFATFGLGFASIDADDATGMVSGGGTYNVSTDPDDEIILTVGLGYRKRYSERWAFEATFSYDYHLADWEVTDQVSGMRGTVDDYDAFTFLLGLAYGF